MSLKVACVHLANEKSISIFRFLTLVCFHILSYQLNSNALFLFDVLLWTLWIFPSLIHSIAMRIFYETINLYTQHTTVNTIELFEIEGASCTSMALWCDPIINFLLWVLWSNWNVHIAPIHLLLFCNRMHFDSFSLTRTPRKHCGTPAHKFYR